MTTGFGVFLNNCTEIFRGVLLRPVRPARINSDLPQIVMSICVLILAFALSDAVQMPDLAGVDIWGVVTLAGHLFFFLTAIVIAVLITRMSALTGAFIVGITLAYLMGGALAYLSRLFLGPDPGPVSGLLPVGLLLAPVAFFVFSIRPGAFWKRGLSAVVFTGLVCVANMGLLPRLPLFAPAEDVADVYVPVDVEALYYAQDPLMTAQVEKLPPQTAGRTDFYGIALGGDASQRVFLREVEAVSDILTASHVETGGMLRLANSQADPMRYPLANLPNLERSMRALADSMDPAEDIAVIYMTSHGRVDEFALSFWQADVNTLRAETMARVLDESGLKNVIVIVSACYSGSFLDDLASPDRMIITASAANRTSFGCNDENDWTWWGRALFDEALRDEPDFREAFVTAQDRIRQWEERDSLEASMPQMIVGSRIGAVLDARFGTVDDARADLALD